ncbi:MAG: LLM class flavin-dependent oxidoreductase [Xanthobacteraceae bacterium]|nr:LLM class flavin-dependent oxidoreductase [Xanthobacteraceae bacterium]MBV9628238.1 LLM class flavin-dependent oxidoreductase [Xanthobacteraceae bacterium]
MRAASNPDRLSMYNQNRLKIGLFGANCSCGRAVTTVPERWSGTWPDNLRLARLADDAGIDFMLPIARWKSYGPRGDYQAATLETLTWATALLGATRRITVFGTVHAPLFNPIMAAKQMVTADHVGEGRFGLNLVVGWNEGEFEMFGVRQREHDLRYDYAQEWLDVVNLIWSPRENFDFEGKFLVHKGIRAHPKPFGGSRPIIMNAGASPVGRTFAIRNCDAFFTNVMGLSLEEQGVAVRKAQAEARSHGRELDVYTVGVITCRPSQKEAEDYYNYSISTEADWTSVDEILAAKHILADQMPPEQFQKMRRQQANGMGGLPLVGDPDRVAQQLAQLADAGLRGIGISFVNYLDELPYFCAEVLPRLARLGLRESQFRTSS